jgi:predicted acylesterase/phospholipase RssA
MLDNTYQCNNIDTLVLSGGGTHGIVYLSILKYLTEQNMLSTITKYYGVSAGSLTALCFIIGLTYNELYDIFVNKINFKDLMKIELSNILTITKKLGLNDGIKLESTIKYILELKGLNPYITLSELYKHTNKEFYIGATSLFKSKFILFSYKSHPKLPVWVAIRMSCSIPILFTPLQYYELDDIFVDGGILNNNPINYVIGELIANNSEDINSADNIEDINSEDKETKEEKNYKFNFICINLEAYNYSFNDISSLSFFQYLKVILHQLFINQSYNKNKYGNYIIQIPTYKYDIIDSTKNNIDINDLQEVLNDVYNIFEEEFKKKIKNICSTDK